MRMKSIFAKIAFFPFAFLFLARGVHAHCPLCTMGVAVVAGGAAWYGVSKAVIALFVGAFAVSTGWWFAKIIKKKYVPFQGHLFVALSFFLTVIPLLPILKDIYPFYLSVGGDYGSLLNRTYVFNTAWIASILGGIIVAASPMISRTITQWRKGKTFPFQGIFLTLLFLILAGVIIEMVM